MGKGLYAIHVNIRSLFPKIYQLRAWLAYNNPDIITLSETWLSEGTTDSSLKIGNFKLYRADRGSRGGGVATYVAANMKSRLISPKVKPELFEGFFN